MLLFSLWKKNHVASLYKPFYSDSTKNSLKNRRENGAFLYGGFSPKQAVFGRFDLF
jgi:hypothetical protein